MRIISGEFRGRNINMIKSSKTRPTQDKVREAIFNIIMPYVNKGVFLDLFGGSGSVGLEGISRGFEKCYFNDSSYEAINVIKSNIDLLKIKDKCVVTKLDYKQALKQYKVKFDCIFLDPPYKMEIIDEIIELIIKYDLLNVDGIIVCEYDKDYKLKENELELKKFVNYGIRNVSIFRRVI